MKKAARKTILLITTLLTCLLMLSTATAVPVANSEPVMDLVEEHEELQILLDKINEIQNLDISLKEKQTMIQDLIDIDGDYLLLNLFIIYCVIFPKLPLIMWLSIFILNYILSIIYEFKTDPPSNLEELWEIHILSILSGGTGLILATILVLNFFGLDIEYKTSLT